MSESHSNGQRPKEKPFLYFFNMRRRSDKLALALLAVVTASAPATCAPTFNVVRDLASASSASPQSGGRPPPHRHTASGHCLQCHDKCPRPADLLDP